MLLDLWPGPFPQAPFALGISIGDKKPPIGQWAAMMELGEMNKEAVRSSVRWDQWQAGGENKICRGTWLLVQQGWQANNCDAWLLMLREDSRPMAVTRSCRDDRWLANGSDALLLVL